MSLPKVSIRRADDPLHTKFTATIGGHTFDEGDLPTIRIYKWPNSARTDLTILFESDLPFEDQLVLDVDDSAEYRKIQAEGEKRRAAKKTAK